MNTIIFQIMRAGVVLGVALFAFAGQVFAAPMLSPVATSHIYETGATLTGYVSNPAQNSTIWFEIGEDASLTGSLALGMNAIYDKGFFLAYATNLKPNTTYYYRSGAMDGGAKVYSSTASFKTTSGQAPQTLASLPIISLTPNASVNTSKTETKNTVEKTTVVKKEVSTEKIVDGFNNGGTALAIGAGDGMLPTTLLGWIALLILILVALSLFMLILDSFEKQAKKKEEEKLEGGEQKQ